MATDSPRAFALDLEALASEGGLDEVEFDDVTVPIPDDTMRSGQREIVVLAPSHDGLLVIMSVLQAGKDEALIAQTINIFMNMLEDDDARYIKTRLFNPRDLFSSNAIAQILVHCVEQWSGGRPTGTPRSSTASRRAAGSRSTARQRSAARTRRSDSAPDDS